ncbi:MAG: ABC transporter ATP-binding protein [Clostridia bacterium]|nr:ABC transporter ATP-binding protein [Clostridia bacterium]
MNVLEVKDLVKKYGDFPAINGINLEVKPGEVYGFIGPNGAGKTTTIRTVLGILKANGGEVKVFEQDAWSDAVKIHERIAYVPGDVNLWSNLTGGEVIDLFLRLRGQKNQDKKYKLIEKFDLDVTKKCRTYSKGNRQKVGLIAALASEADLYILDEPTSGLDPLMERVFQECIMDLKAEGKSIFLSSHILSEVEQLCDRISIIKNGKIIETGSMKELRHLTRSLVSVKTKLPLEQIDQLEGVKDVRLEDGVYQFQVDAKQIGEVMTYLANHQIEYIENMPPTLEDLFMHHYGKEEA